MVDKSVAESTAVSTSPINTLNETELVDEYCHTVMVSLHHVSFDKVQAQRHFLHPFLHAVYSLYGVGQDNVRALVKPN